MPCLLRAFFLLSSCSSGEDEPLTFPTPPSGLLKSGTHTLEYTYYAPLPKQPVTLYYHIPEDGNVQTMPVLFLMHGANRDGMYQIDTWKAIANERQIMIFAPEFSSTYYPGNRSYQYGGVSNSENSWIKLDPDKWTVSLIEHLFDFVKQQTGNINSKYDLWGHSAGAQFSHRLMFHLPQARIRMAVVSNSGSYLIPSLEGYGAAPGYAYPFSLKGTPYTADDIKAYFARNMVVHLGTNDLCTTQACDSQLPMSSAAVAQGASRYERGTFFYNYAKTTAASLSLPFNWQLVEVVGVDHNSRRMAQTRTTGAADLLYGNK